jgi:hypothetical protein
LVDITEVVNMEITLEAAEAAAVELHIIAQMEAPMVDMQAQHTIGI